MSSVAAIKDGLFEKSIVWWGSLNRRERQMIGGAAVFVVLAIGYFVLFLPAWKGRIQIGSELPGLRVQVAKMEALSSELKDLSAIRSSSKSRAAVKAAVNQSLANAGLSSHAKLDATDNLIRVKLDQVGFDRTLNWLLEAVQEAKVRVVDVSIVRDAKAGAVAATIAFEQPSGKAR